MNAWRFHQWHGYVARMTVPAIAGGAEGKLQRPQWQPGQPPRRRIRFCYCTIIMIIEWHNTRFSHTDWHICVDELCQDWFRQWLVAWTAPSQYPIPCWNFDHFSKHSIFIKQYTFENVVCCGMPAILPLSQWDISTCIIVRNSAYIYIYIYIRLSVYIKQGVTMATPRQHGLLSQRDGATSDHIVVTPSQWILSV